MRELSRIKEINDLIEKIWLIDPYLRYFQLIYNLQSTFTHHNSGVGKITEVESDGFERIGYDMFNVEDDVLIDFLQTYLAGKFKKT